MSAMDPIDLVLLRMLQQNGRVSQHDLARAVALSAPAVAERLRKLEERGVIAGYTVLLDPQALGVELAAFISVGVAGSRHFSTFRARVEEQTEITECHAITGEASHLLKVRVASARDLEDLLATIQSWPGVQWTRTSVVLSTVKETWSVPLPESAEEVAAGSGATSRLLHVPFRHHS
jgi:Lrp/AsnC family transcriptional regulator, leucine-responsive regulatory protein